MSIFQLKDASCLYSFDTFRDQMIAYSIIYLNDSNLIDSLILSSHNC